MTSDNSLPKSARLLALLALLSAAQAAELRRFVREVRPYSPMILGAADASDRIFGLAGRAWRKAMRLTRAGAGPDKG